MVMNLIQIHPHRPTVDPDLTWVEISRTLKFSKLKEGQSILKKNRYRFFLVKKHKPSYLEIWPIGSMVLLYMVCHGSHQYIPVMLAFFYQHHGSVMGDQFIQLRIFKDPNGSVFCWSPAKPGFPWDSPTGWGCVFLDPRTGGKPPIQPSNTTDHSSWRHLQSWWWLGIPHETRRWPEMACRYDMFLRKMAEDKPVIVI